MSISRIPARRLGIQTTEVEMTGERRISLVEEASPAFSTWSEPNECSIRGFYSPIWRFM